MGNQDDSAAFWGEPIYRYTRANGFKHQLLMSSALYTFGDIQPFPFHSSWANNKHHKGSSNSSALLNIWMIPT